MRRWAGVAVWVSAVAMLSGCTTFDCNCTCISVDPPGQSVPFDRSVCVGSNEEAIEAAQAAITCPDGFAFGGCLCEDTGQSCNTSNRVAKSLKPQPDPRFR
jgi:hypothetical protein